MRNVGPAIGIVVGVVLIVAGIVYIATGSPVSPWSFLLLAIAYSAMSATAFIRGQAA